MKTSPAFNEMVEEKWDNPLEVARGALKEAYNWIDPSSQDLEWQADLALRIGLLLGLIHNKKPTQFIKQSMIFILAFEDEILNAD
jgi:hypothetical protein